MNRDNIVCGNYSYGLFSLDYFLDSMNRLNQTNIEFWGAGPHLYQDECSVSDVDAIVKKDTKSSSECYLLYSGTMYVSSKHCFP